MRDLCARRTVQMGAREARELTQPPSLQRLLTDMPEVPVVALVGEQAGRGERKGRAAMLNHFRSEMRAHPHGGDVTAADSGHHIPGRSPDCCGRDHPNGAHRAPVVGQPRTRTTTTWAVVSREPYDGE
jgi:hypothetical protein